MRKRLPLAVAITPLYIPNTDGAKKNIAGAGTGIVVVTNKMAVTIRHYLI